MESKKPLFIMALFKKGRQRERLWDLLLSVILLVMATGIGLIFKHHHLAEANVITVYIFNVLLIAAFTRRRIYSLLGALISVLLFNYFFTIPVWSLNAYDKGYWVTFLIMFASAFLTGSLAERLKKETKKVEQVAKEREEARVKMENEKLRADLLRSISHDFRTPLTSMIGDASLLIESEEGLSKEERTLMYQDIERNGIWLNHLIENVLSVTKLQEGKMNFHFAPQWVNEVVEEAVEKVRRLHKNHPIHVSLPEEMVFARMDPGLIVQVLINLLDNGMKYSKEGSPLYVSCKELGAMVYFYVEDEGIGISDDNKEKLFEMFYTAKEVCEDGSRSLGLGLTLCQEVIEAHGGKIYVKDRKEGGTIFSFTLPKEEVGDWE